MIFALMMVTEWLPKHWIMAGERDKNIYKNAKVCGAHVNKISIGKRSWRYIPSTGPDTCSLCMYFTLIVCRIYTSVVNTKPMIVPVLPIQDMCVG
jgi:hypothetical protein